MFKAFWLKALRELFDAMAASSSAARSWEGWGEPSHDNDAAPTWGDPDYEEFDYASVPADVAGDELAHMIIQLKHDGKLSAKQACILSFWAEKAGAGGFVSKLAMHPEHQSGKYSRKFDEAVGSGLGNCQFYNVRLGRRHRHDASRRFDLVPTIPPHEALAEELRSSQEAGAELARAKAEGELPPRYLNHPAVLGAPAGVDVHPICLYLDAVPYHRMDSALGVWVYFMLTGQRHLVCVLRRSELCACGCRGWCSMFPVFDMLGWSFAAMLRGEHPNARHDVQPWREEDAGRASYAGEELGFRAVCVLVKGDWHEFCHTIGVPSWRDNHAPCPLCFASLASWYSPRGLSPVHMPHGTKRLEHYLAACRACTIEVDVTAPHHAQLRGLLQYDKRKSGGSCGRALTQDVPALGLRNGARLEPSQALPDVASFEETPTPFRVSFWRRSAETFTRHANPLFGARTGVSSEYLSIDWLHALSMGVFQFFLAELVWDLIVANVWNESGPLSSVVELSAARLRSDLHQFYQSELKRGRNYTQVGRLYATMLGSSDDRKLKLFGAETNGFLHFAPRLLSLYGHRLGARETWYRIGVERLLSILAAIKQYPRVFPPAAVQKFVDDVCEFTLAVEKLGHPTKPKHHALIEMAARTVGENTNVVLRVDICVLFAFTFVLGLTSMSQDTRWRQPRACWVLGGRVSQWRPQAPVPGGGAYGVACEGVVGVGHGAGQQESSEVKKSVSRSAKTCMYDPTAWISTRFALVCPRDQRYAPARMDRAEHGGQRDPHAASLWARLALPPPTACEGEAPTRRIMLYDITQSGM